MQKSRLPLVLLILALGCALCLCMAVSGAALFAFIIEVTRIELPEMEAITPEQPIVEAHLRDEAGVNLIAVQGRDGNLYTIGRAGGEPIRLTEGAEESRVFRQPTWSPDASRLAWVEIEGSDTGLSSALVTALSDGSGTTRADTADRPPFYLAWSPDNARIAALSSWDEGLALRTVDVAAGGTALALVGQGQPLYFAWSPDGQRFVAHLDDEKVSLLSTAGEETELDAAAGLFGAPEWMADGAAFVYAQREGGSRKLVLADPSGAIVRHLAELEGTATFSLSPDGRRVAFVDTQEQIATAALGPLAVARLDEDAAPEQIDEGPVLAFFWSPQGDKIAYLTPGDIPANGPRASLDLSLRADHLNLWLQWRVWDGERVVDLSQFRPTDTFLIDYLRFFDQYTRSMTPWAPDGSAFVYAGDSEDESPGIWVQPVAEGAEPVRLMDGVYAAWSPR